jgi:surfactin synthase thioesterase subunit
VLFRSIHNVFEAENWNNEKGMSRGGMLAFKLIKTRSRKRYALSHLWCYVMFSTLSFF